MFYYAQLNENKICIGLSKLAGEKNEENLVRINEFNEDYLYRKYENGTWSTEKYEPQSTAPLNEFEQLKQELSLVKIALDELILGGAL